MPYDPNDPETKAAIEAASKEASKAAIEAEHAGLLAKRDELLGDNKALRDRLKGFEGVDADEFRSMKSAAEQAEEERLRKDKDFDQILANQETKFQGVISEKNTALDRIRSELHREKITTVATRALADAKGSPELLMPHLTSRMSLDDDNALVINGKDGTPMFNGQGQRANVNDLVAELKADPIMSRAFDAGVVSGTGARNTGNGTGSHGTSDNNPFVRDKEGQWDVYKAMELVRANPDEARRLADETGEKFAGVND